ncbi:MAG: hypothetical protein LBI27_06985 [Clostridiales bacterium]|nr:hypothetical protein [Clostridiales bacterium]
MKTRILHIFIAITLTLSACGNLNFFESDIEMLTESIIQNLENEGEGEIEIEIETPPTLIESESDTETPSVLNENGNYSRTPVSTSYRRMKKSTLYPSKVAIVLKQIFYILVTQR